MTTTTNQPTQAQWDAANRFLDQLFIDPILANGYQQISQQANGQDNAPEILTTWLQQEGYDTTPELVYAALINLQNTSLGYWTGIYGQSFLGSSEPAPVLAIGPDIAGNTVAYLDGVELKNFVFESVETDNAFHPTLSWDLDSNQTAGNITFYYTSAVTLDPNPPTGYTGNWFEGTLQTSVSSSFQRYYGAIGKPADPSVMSQLILASGKEQSWWDKYSTYVYIGIGTVVVIVIIGVFVYRKKNVPERDFQEVRQDKEQLTAEEWTEKFKQDARFADDFNDPYSVLSRTAKKVIATYKSEKISERQFLDAFDLAGQSINPYEFTAEEFHQMFERKALATLKEKEINQYHQSTESKARQAIAEELGDKIISYEQFNRAVEAKMQELGANKDFRGQQDDLSKIELPAQMPEVPRPPAEFQPPKKKSLSRKEIAKHINEQKNLFSKLGKVEPTVMESLQNAYSEEMINIPLAIANIYKNPNIVDQWEPLIKKGKDNDYFDKSLAKKWQEQPEALKKHSEGAEGHWINGTWCSQDLIKWRDNRDKWLNKVGKMLSESHSIKVEQQKSTDPKVIEPKKPSVNNNPNKPGDSTQKTSGSTPKEVLPGNTGGKTLNDKGDPAKQPGDQEDPDLKKSEEQSKRPNHDHEK